jgi:magnesium chelatase subunit D
VLPLVLSHRARAGGRSSTPPPLPPSNPHSDTAPRNQGSREAIERIFAPQEIDAPLIKPGPNAHAARGVSQATLVDHPGPVVGVRRTESCQEIDLRATVNHAIRETGEPLPRLIDLHEKVRAPKSGTRYLFVIDSSGSHAAQEKIRLVKGAVLGLLNRSFQIGDEIAIVACRGTSAQVLLEPSHMLDDAVAALEYLPTGGADPSGPCTGACEGVFDTCNSSHSLE